MAAGWLISVDHRGLTVTASFMERLRSGNKAALRALAKADLTPLYRRAYSKLKPEQEYGLFYTDEAPETVLVPLVRGGPHPPRAWVRDTYSEVMSGTFKTKRELKGALGFAKAVRRGYSADEELFVKIMEGGKRVRADKMVPNPKFELVVVNKHDRAALLKLLGEVDTSSNVRQWLAERTKQTGATRSMVLYEDYVKWCEQATDAPAGKKSFAQALVAGGVVKLPRSGAGERYELTLRPTSSR